jgi:hypothetical protein
MKYRIVERKTGEESIFTIEKRDWFLCIPDWTRVSDSYFSTLEEAKNYIITNHPVKPKTEIIIHEYKE